MLAFGRTAGTIALPITPAMRAAIVEGRRAGSHAIPALEVGCASALAAALTGETGMAAATLVVLTIGTVALRRYRDAHEVRRLPTYCRTTGPVVVEYYGRLGARCRLVDRAFWVDETAGLELAAIAPLGWGTVEYSEIGPYIFEVRDADGRCLYRATEYRPPDSVGR